MAVRSHPAEEQLNATGFPNLVLICGAFYLKVGGISIENIDVGRLDVYVREEMLVHETVVALGMFPWNTNVFVLCLKISICNGALGALN